jgi:hypothetical protein
VRQLVQCASAVGALALLAAPASAQMTTPKGAGHQGAAGTEAMMSECSTMMQELMADPVVRKRMTVLMQKHMQQHAGQHSTMTPGGPGADAMQGGATRSGSSSHEAHHSPAPLMSAAPAASPTPTASP